MSPRDVAPYARLALGLRRYVRTPTDASTAVMNARRRLEQREQNLARMFERHV